MCELDKYVSRDLVKILDIINELFMQMMEIQEVQILAIEMYTVALILHFPWPVVTVECDIVTITHGCFPSFISFIWLYFFYTNSKKS